eukprot:TRINITY_DN17959_c1_g1_i1.p1 TRINITY_DN17959_c1_g1~~TRINITY_DN17959_c1_g1_i1.p1  ORF type:complete len:1479 (+),score=540.20 TRINITY_DN17959_c1_g1_i1:1-4437(+)
MVTPLLIPVRKIPLSSVVDLSNNHVFTPERISTHRSGQLSFWEMQTHFKNAAQIAGDGLLFFYLSTRAAYGSASDKSGPPDCICTYDTDSKVSLEDLVRKLASLVTEQCTTVVVLDLAVSRQFDATALPNIASLCPPRFSVLLSLTPECASIFTPLFLKSITRNTDPNVAGYTLKDVAWSDEVNSELNRVAASCFQAEEAEGLHPSLRKWASPSWVPLTAARDLDDISMNTTIGNPAASTMPQVVDDTKVLLSLTKKLYTIPDTLTQLFSKLRAVETMLGHGGRGDHIVAMQALQCVVVSQTSSTPHKAWEEFRSAYLLVSGEMQKCDKEDPDLPRNHMATYIKLGDVYQPNSQAEQEWKYLEDIYLQVTTSGRDFYFGSDPKAGLDSELYTSTEQACRCQSLSLRLEPTFSVSTANYVRLVHESRIPSSATTLLDGVDGVFTMRVHKLKQLLHPRNTGVRYLADTVYQKKQHERASAAKRMDISRAMGANQNGLVEPSPTNRGISQWLQVSQEAQIESAIRIQSVFRMFAVRKMHRLLLMQLGDVPRDGVETRRVVRQWLLACAKHFSWHPLSSCVVCRCASGLSQRNPDLPYSYVELMQWTERLVRLRSQLTERIVSELSLPRGSLRIESITGYPAGHQFVVKLRVVSEWSGPGDVVPAEVRADLDITAHRVANHLNYALREEFQTSNVGVNTEKVIRGLEHIDVREATCEQSIRAVLTGKSDLQHDVQGLPPSIRHTLETGLDPNNDPRDYIIYALLADDECSVPMGWKRHVLEAPLLPGNAVCVKPQAGSPLAEALQVSIEQRSRSQDYTHYKDVYGVFLVGRLRGDKALVYESPGVRQLEKTPLVMYSRYWADAGYYDDVTEFMVLVQSERLKLMMHTVRERRELKYRYDTSLFVDLWRLFISEVRGCRLRFVWGVSMVLVALVAYMIFLLPLWFSNVTSLIYLVDMSQLSLEQIVTWILIYMLLLLGALFVTGACLSHVKSTFVYKVRTVFIYICAKYSRLVSADLVSVMRESDLRMTVSLMFVTFPKLFIAFFLGASSLIAIFATSVSVGLVCALYMVLKLALHTVYDKFMVRHMTAISNIEKEEQLRWVVLRGPQGAAGHVVAQAADDHQMRLCLFAREKRHLNQSNMTVHTVTAVVDWLLMFSLPAFLLFIAANEVAEPPEDGKQMAQLVGNIPYLFFHYLLMLFAWRLGLHASVEVVEHRPCILRFLTVMTHIQLTVEEREEMRALLDIGKDDTLLADQMHVTRDGATPNPRDVGDEGDSPARAAPTGVSLRNRRGWYKKKMLLEFDWFNALLDQHPLSTVLLYLCFLFWLGFAVCVIIFIATSWSSECKSINAECKVLDTYFTVGTVEMPQHGDGYGRCLLMNPVAYSLGRCAELLRRDDGHTAFTFKDPTGEFSLLKVAIQYNTWQAGAVGFYQTFAWNTTHPSPCPMAESNFTSYRAIRMADIEREEELTETFDPAFCGSAYSDE